VNAGSRKYLDREKNVSFRAEGVVAGDDSDAMAVAARIAGEGASLSARRRFRSADGSRVRFRQGSSPVTMTEVPFHADDPFQIKAAYTAHLMGTLRSTMSRKLSSVTRTSPSCSTLRRDHISGGSVMPKLRHSWRTTSLTAAGELEVCLAARSYRTSLPSKDVRRRTEGRINPGPDRLGRVRDGVARLDRL
jgi:hypothetical protein